MPSLSSWPDQPVFTLPDLTDWPSDATWLAVLGHPIKHSMSPALHHAALAELARTDPRFAQWRYLRLDVPPEDLPEALSRLHALKFRGLNLTVPHKVLALAGVAKVDPAAQPIGAVNTLQWTEAGWAGFNTDGFGLTSGLKRDLGVTVLAGAHIILLGAGGAARGAAVELLQQGCASLWIGNRTAVNREALIAALRPIAGATRLQGFDPQSPPPDLPASAWVINATSAGLSPTDLPPIDLRRLAKPAGVYDMIYHPPQTPLLAQAHALGLPQANGLSMLVYQGARALEIWTGQPTPVAPMHQAAEAEMKRRQCV